MRKSIRIAAAAMGAALVLQGAPAAAVNASPTTNPIYVDGRQVELDSYTINGYTYYKIRDLAEVLDFKVGYDTSTDSILLWNTASQSSADPEQGGQQTPSTVQPQNPGPLFSPGQQTANPSVSKPDNASNRSYIDGKLIVIVDAGHGGSDVGTHDEAEKYFERDFNIAVAVQVKALLEQNGVQVLMLREPEETERIPESERIRRIDQFVKQYPVDLLLSIHHNANNENAVTKASGSEILVQIAYEHGGAGQELANCIEERYRAIGRTIRPTKYQHSEEDPKLDRLYLLKEAYSRDLLAVMSEYCFLDVPDDLAWVLTEEGIQKEASALVSALLDYYATHAY